MSATQQTTYYDNISLYDTKTYELPRSLEDKHFVSKEHKLGPELLSLIAPGVRHLLSEAQHLKRKEPFPDSLGEIQAIEILDEFKSGSTGWVYKVKLELKNGQKITAAMKLYKPSEDTLDLMGDELLIYDFLSQTSAGYNMVKYLFLSEEVLSRYPNLGSVRDDKFHGALLLELALKPYEDSNLGKVKSLDGRRSFLPRLVEILKQGDMSLNEKRILLSDLFTFFAQLYFFHLHYYHLGIEVVDRKPGDFWVQKTDDERRLMVLDFMSQYFRSDVYNEFLERAQSLGEVVGPLLKQRLSVMREYGYVFTPEEWRNRGFDALTHVLQWFWYSIIGRPLNSQDLQELALNPDSFQESSLGSFANSSIVWLVLLSVFEQEWTSYGSFIQDLEQTELSEPEISTQFQQLKEKLYFRFDQDSLSATVKLIDYLGFVSLLLGASSAEEFLSIKEQAYSAHPDLPWELVTSEAVKLNPEIA